MGHSDKDRAEKDHAEKNHSEKSHTEKFEFLATLDIQRAADYLSRIAEGLRKGTLNLSAGGRSISLAPTSMVKIELEAESRGSDAGRGNLELEITWKDAYVAAAETLEISVEPRAEAVAAPPKG